MCRDLFLGFSFYAAFILFTEEKKRQKKKL